MDFRQSSQPGVTRPTAAPVVPEHKEPKQNGKTKGGRSFLQIASAVLLVGIAVVLVGVAVFISRSEVTGESKYVDTSKYQAVFLNNGQVYFGNIQTLNKQFVRLTSVYYLTQSGDASTSSNYSLVKLGCQQIHDPYDQMVINRDQVTFWENLNADGKVVKSIEEFKKQNPNGPDCSQVSNQTQADTSTTQGTSTTPSTTTKK